MKACTLDDVIQFRALPRKSSNFLKIHTMRSMLIYKNLASSASIDRTIKNGADISYVQRSYINNANTARLEGA